MITKDSKNILVADDSLFFRAKLSDILMEAGHKVRLACDGKGVIDAIKANIKVDLVILDLQMPDIDGFGVLKWLDENNYKGKIPVLAITGAYEACRITDELKRRGVSGFMSKEFPPEQVVFRINRLLFADKIAGEADRKRVAVSIPVDFFSGKTPYTGVIINIGEGGVFMHTNIKLTEGTELDLRFSLPGTGKVLNLKGTVRWFPTELGPRNLFCGCGIMFSSLPDADRDALHKFIETETSKLEQIPQGRY